MKEKIKKHWSTVLLGIIVLILLVPSWRVSFQGWIQGFMANDIAFERNLEEEIPAQIMNQWTIQDLKQNEFEFNHFTDRPILLSFWATWCPPCRVELKELAKLNEELGDKIHIIAVSEEAFNTVVNSGLGETYPFLYTTSAYPNMFNIQSYPSLFILDKGGIIINKHFGAGGLDNEKNRSFLKALI
ncbi:TlpA family protein disulfide reductase [Crocinitomix algicola]|uniref:TlpA family protein disulfide reductase n=1 Tax=Crocinitomix algicola TaxID=1740263 RepID=UPI00082AC3BE|nr:TlpA disulfide reductase family protein [Crocinitomix algicola]